MVRKILYLTSLVGVGILGLQLAAWCSEIDTGRDLYLLTLGCLMSMSALKLGFTTGFVSYLDFAPEISVILS